MANDRREKDSEWYIRNENGELYNSESPLLAVLMDIRDELKTLNQRVTPLRHLDCRNFLAMPALMKRVADNTTKPRRKKAKR